MFALNFHTTCLASHLSIHSVKLPRTAQFNHGPSTVGGCETDYLKVRAYTGQDTQVSWAGPVRSIPAHLLFSHQLLCIYWERIKFVSTFNVHIKQI